MSKRSRDDYDDRVFNGDRDRGGNGGSSSGRSHGQNKKVGERFTGKVTKLFNHGGVIDRDVYVHKSFWPCVHNDVRVGDTFEMLLQEYRQRGSSNFEGFRFFGKVSRKIENSEEHRERRENRQHQVQGSRGEGSSRASPPPGRERRRESDEKDRRVRKDESRREEGGDSQRLQVGDGIRVSSRKEASVWFRGKVTDILPDGGGEIDGDICVSPWRHASEADGSGLGRRKKTNVEWSKCNFRKGDIVTVRIQRNTREDVFLQWGKNLQWYATDWMLPEEFNQSSLSRGDREERRRHSNEGDRVEGRNNGPVIEGSGDHDTPRKRNSSTLDFGSNSRESSGLGTYVVEGDGGGSSGGGGADPRLRPPALSRDNSFMSQDRESPVTPASASGAGADMGPRDPRLPPAAAAAAAATTTTTSVDFSAGNGTPDISSEQRSPVEPVEKWAPANELTWADLSSVTMTPIDPPDYSVFPQAWNGGLAYKQQVFDVSFRHVMGNVQLVMEALGSLQGGQIEVKARVSHDAVESKFTRQLSAREDLVTCLVISSEGSASIEDFESYLEQRQKCAYVELSDKCHALVMPSGTPLHKALLPGVKHPAVIAWVHDREGAHCSLVSVS